MIRSRLTARTHGLFVGQLRQLPGVGSLTGLYKTPVDGPLWLSATGLEGDVQADRANHGGPERALNHYPAEHYPHWRDVFPERADEFTAPALGENLSTTGLTEADVRAGDVFALGGARIQISQPRNPCYKIARRMQLRSLAREVALAGRSGWLYRVLEPGRVSPDDDLELLDPADHGVTLAALWSLRNDRRPALDLLERMARLPGLADSWREVYASKLETFRRWREQG